MMSRDYFDDPGKSKELIYRHLAWLSILRYEMRQSRTWESTDKPYNAEYRRLYCIPEKETSLERELARYLAGAELEAVIAANCRTSFLMSEQSKTVAGLFRDQKIVVLQFIDMQRALKELLLHQGRSERIKEFPYPRQYATVSGLFVNLFCLLLPFGMLREFDALNDSVEGLMKGYMVWLVIPFSVLIAWMYTSLEQVGQSTENPFEGSPNDVPISQMSRTVERDLREVLGETDLPLPLSPRNHIVL
jgi:putative membrane protein